MTAVVDSAAGEEGRARDDIVRLGRSIIDRGLTSGSSGNLSVRLGDGSLLVTPTGCSLGELEPDGVSRCDPAGRPLSGPSPTKEAALHVALYATRPESRGIVHLHSTWSVALSMLEDTDPEDALPLLTPYPLMRLGTVRMVPFFRPGDPAGGRAIRALDGRHKAVLLANHGPVVADRSLREALFATEELEEGAKLALLTRGLPVRPLSASQIDEVREHFPCG